jgi:trehalose synthase
MVNALQRRADMVAQRSLAEGFGPTVIEGMWKGRAVIASRVGASSRGRRPRVGLPAR